MNGVTGQVLEYVWRNSQITAIIVEFDDKNVGEKIIKENMDLDEVKKHSNGISIFKESLTYKVPKKISSQKSGKKYHWGFLALLGDFGYSQNGGGTFSDFLIFFSPWLYLLITTSSSLKAVE